MQIIKKCITKVFDEEERDCTKLLNLLHEEKLKKDAEKEIHHFVNVHSLLIRC